MKNKIQGIQEILSNKIKTSISEKLCKITQDYKFLLVSANLSFDQNEQIYQNLQKSRVIVIDHYEETLDLNFIISFHKTILFINQTQLQFVNPLLSYKGEIELLFLTEKKDIFDQMTKLKYKEQKRNDQKQFDEEISNFCNVFFELKKHISNIIDLWKKISKCMSAYMIQNSYNLLTKDRVKKFFARKNKNRKTQIISKNDYIELHIIGSGSFFITVLIYHINKRKLLVIKKTNLIIDKEISKLLKREVENYSKISHQFLPKFYGTVEGENWLVIEYINGRTLENIEELHLSEVEKFVIIFQLISVFKYLHQNNMIYRDLKPDNVMIDNNKTLVLIDFDRMIMNDYMTRTIDLNSPFIAPEVNSYNVTYKCDYYSIGKLIIYILGENYSDHLYIQKLCEKCMEVNSRDRVSNLFSDFKNCMYRNRIDIVIYFFTLAANSNDKYAQNSIGSIYCEGKFVSQDINKAIHYYSLAADQNESCSQFNLGLIYSNGIGVSQDINKAIHYYSLAADQNNLDAQCNLGFIYHNGEGVSRDINKAIHYYSLAANQNHAEAQLNLGSIYYRGDGVSKDINKAIHYYSLAANQNQDNAQFFLGLIYYKGEGISQDINKAIYYFFLAASKNNLDAQFYLGFIYYKGKVISQDIKKAIHYFSLAANQNDSYSQFYLGFIYHMGEGVSRDINKAIHYYSLAANQNHDNAQFNLGSIYYNGDGVTRDINKAIYYCSLVANQNNSIAQFYLGLIYYNGDGVSRDINKAIHYFSLAANQNDSIAQFFLGLIYYNGKGVSQDINKAIHYYSLAANQNDSSAMCCLGLIYYNSKSPIESRKGINYLTISAKQNNQWAQYLLGIFYFEGNHVKKKVDIGIDLLIRSADNGFKESDFLVGFLYQKGEFKYLQQNINKSIHYYKEASSFNNQYAKNNLGIIYKNGFKDEIPKLPEFSKEYFNEAIRQKNDKVAMYNISLVYIYEDKTDKSIDVSIDLLIKSSNLGFEPSTKMLCLVLVKKYGTKMNIIEETISKYTKNYKEFIAKFQKIITQNKLDDQFILNEIYENQKAIDYLYDFFHEPIESKKVLESMNDERQENIPTGEYISQNFYDGFGIDVQSL